MHFNTYLLSTTLLLQIIINPSISSSSSEDEIDFPPKLDSDDISYFASTYDIDGLHWALSNVFQRSIRNPNSNQVVHNKLPSSIIARGGGSTYTSAYKLKVDIEQAQYLSEYLDANNNKKTLFQRIKAMYEKVHHRIPPLDQLSRTKGLYPFTKQDYEDGIASIYNKASSNSEK